MSCVVMTAASWVCSSPLSHALLPCLRSCPPSSHFSTFSRFRSFFASHRWLMSSASPLKPPGPAVFAQARRSSSSKFKEDEIASGKHSKRIPVLKFFVHHLIRMRYWLFFLGNLEFLGDDLTFYGFNSLLLQWLICNLRHPLKL